MPHFSQTSMDRLNTCHPVIVAVMLKAIMYQDFSIIHGQRTPEEQFELFKKGRQINEQGEWVIYDKDLVVTYKDGTEKKSKHNYEPQSMAVDVAPWPTLWEDKGKMYELGGVIKTVQQQMFKEGKITSTLKWGYDLWSWDEGHYEL